jgi:hypothetical protein
MTDASGTTGVLLLGGWNEPLSDDAEWQGVSAFRPDSGWIELADAVPEPGDVFAFDAQSGLAVFLEVGGGTWAFDPEAATWDELLADAPPAHGARMVYDSRSDRLIAFGGDEFGPLFDTTSVYDPETNTWTEMDPARSPSPRSYFAMAYDERSDRVILFGGWDGLGPLGDTWAYDLETDSWTGLARGGGPEPRVDSAMAYDRETDRVILFGGVTDPLEEPLGDTWAFDSQTNTWSRLDAEGPSARGWHVMAADAETGTIVLFGGGPSREGCTDETWIFDPRTDTWTMSGTAPTIAESLDAIVLPESNAPTGTEFAFEDADAGVQPVQASSPAVQDAARTGQVGSLIRLFFTPKMLDALQAGQEAMDVYAAEFDRSGQWSVGSWASAYDTPDAAADALVIVLGELATTWGLERLDDLDLGDGGAIFGGRSPVALGTPTTIYFWRNGSYLLEVVAHGSVEADADELRSIAEGMQARVTG